MDNNFEVMECIENLEEFELEDHINFESLKLNDASKQKLKKSVDHNNDGICNMKNGSFILAAKNFIDVIDSDVGFIDVYGNLEIAVKCVIYSSLIQCLSNIQIQTEGSKYDIQKIERATSLIEQINNLFHTNHLSCELIFSDLNISNQNDLQKEG